MIQWTNDSMEQSSQSQIANHKSQITKVCLTIAGLDPSGGAGIIADIKTFSAFGCFATAAVSSVTFQNTTGVFGAVHQTAETVREQVEPILRDFDVAAVKTGMLPTREVVEETARLIRENDLRNIVVDPVVRSTSGFDLIDDEALSSAIKSLFPLSDLVTPNIPEAERIARMKIGNDRDLEAAAKAIQEMGARSVLIKGGHLPNAGGGSRMADSDGNATVKERVNRENDRRTARDYLFIRDEVYVFEAEFIETTATHGTGCTLAAAIAANLALGKNLRDAVQIAKQFVNNAIRTAPNLGHGYSPINI